MSKISADYVCFADLFSRPRSYDSFLISKARSCFTPLPHSRCITFHSYHNRTAAFSQQPRNSHETLHCGTERAAHSLSFISIMRDVIFKNADLLHICKLRRAWRVCDFDFEQPPPLDVTIIRMQIYTFVQWRPLTRSLASNLQILGWRWVGSCFV